MAVRLVFLLLVGLSMARLSITSSTDSSTVRMLLMRGEYTAAAALARDIGGLDETERLPQTAAAMASLVKLCDHTIADMLGGANGSFQARLSMGIPVFESARRVAAEWQAPALENAILKNLAWAEYVVDGTAYAANSGHSGNTA